MKVANSTRVWALVGIVLMLAMLPFSGFSQRKVKYTPGSFFKSPVPNMGVAYETFDFDASTGGKKVFRNGTSICVPGGILVSEEGDPVQGTITLSYREMFDATDILLSGVPMHYNTPTGRRQLETGGMFEVFAMRGSQPVFVAPGKMIFIETSSLGPINQRWDFFGFDPDEKEWVRLQNGNTKSIPQGGSAGNDTFDEPYATLAESDAVRAAPMNMDNGDAMGFTGDGEGFNLRRLGLSQFGLYNYDAMLKEQDIVNVVPEFTLNGAPNKELNTVFVAYPGLNTLYYFGSYNWATEFNLFANRPANIFVVLKDGKFAMVPREALANINQQAGKKLKLDLQTVDQKFATPEEIRDFLTKG
jgi:hypothetical protein